MKGQRLSLDARIFDNGSYRTPPIAPPRKRRSTLKKGSTLPTSFENENAVRNGFKDVFINGGTSRALIYDDIEYIDKEDAVVPTRPIDGKLHVGNKKTDKFFGEDLSDHLSDEPVVTIEKSQEVEHESVAQDEVDHRNSSQSDKKLFFLMNMLTEEMGDLEDEERYKDLEPVEEPLFVARKKEIKKHICDDDDHMHHQHFHSHEKETCEHEHDHEHENEERHSKAPPKPDRDFSKYHAKVEETQEKTAPDSLQEKIVPESYQEKMKIQENIHILQETVPEALSQPTSRPRFRKAVSRENLPTPPDTPKRKSGNISIPGTPVITIESIDFHHQKESENHAEVESKRPVTVNVQQEEEIDDMSSEPTSSTPILTHDLVDRMIKKAYGFHDYHPEDFTEHNQDDGSNSAAPKSKLTTRKISVHRKSSTEAVPTAELLTPGTGTPQKKLSSASDDSLRIIDEHHVERAGADSSRTPPKSPMLTTKSRDYEKMLNNSSINDIIEEIYSKNSEIMQEFQSYLEKSVEAEPVINVDAEKEFLKVRGISESDFRATPEPTKLPDVEVEEDNEDVQSYSDSFESTDTEQETISEMKMKIPKHNSRRRESIEDVDNWFSKHLDLEDKQSEVCGMRESTQPSTNYDTNKIFPFGNTIVGRRDSLSDEFFTKLPHNRASIKPDIETLSEGSISEEADKSGSNTNKSSREHSLREESPDHSTLLKYLEKETKDQ